MTFWFIGKSSSNGWGMKGQGNTEVNLNRGRMIQDTDRMSESTDGEAIAIQKPVWTCERSKPESEVVEISDKNKVEFVENLDDESETTTAMAREYDAIGMTDREIAAGFAYIATSATKHISVNQGWYSSLEEVPDEATRLAALKEIAKQKWHYSDRSLSRRTRRSEKIFVLVK